MKRHNLTRSERRQLNRDTGKLAEKIAMSEYTGYSRFVDSDTYDGKRDSGAVIEVKSALSELKNNNPGRFRLFKEQHERLVRRDRDGTADYVFVLFDIDGRKPVAKLCKRKPATIGNMIGARGGWNRSGHTSKGRQHKLPISAVFE